MKEEKAYEYGMLEATYDLTVAESMFRKGNYNFHSLLQYEPDARMSLGFLLGYEKALRTLENYRLFMREQPLKEIKAKIKEIKELIQKEIDVSDMPCKTKENDSGVCPDAGGIETIS